MTTVWTADSNKARQRIGATLTPYRQRQVDYWTELQKLMQQKDGNVRPTRKAMPEYWLGFSIGRSGFQLAANIRFRKNRINVGLILDSYDSKKHFALLLKDRDEIERELGQTLDWDLKPSQRSCSIGTGRDTYDLKNRDNWPDYLDWMYEQLETFHRVFAPRIKTLDASDYIPGETDLDDTEDELG